MQYFGCYGNHPAVSASLLMSSTLLHGYATWALKDKTSFYTYKYYIIIILRLYWDFSSPCHKLFHYVLSLK